MTLKRTSNRALEGRSSAVSRGPWCFAFLRFKEPFVRIWLTAAPMGVSASLLAAVLPRAKWGRKPLKSTSSLRGFEASGRKQHKCANTEKRFPGWEYHAWVILFGEGSLHKGIHEFVLHYHGERNHQRLGNRLIVLGGLQAGACG